MSELDTLLRLLDGAPPRSAQLVRRDAVEGKSLEELARLYQVDLAQLKVLLFRAWLDVQSGGTARVADADEPAQIAGLLDPAAPPSDLRALRERFTLHAPEVQKAIDAAVDAFEKSPDRKTDEWVRRAAIVIVIALSAYFYWREATKPRPPNEKRPLLVPAPANPGP
ncbi:MAG: hypothetical protein U0228_01610 [Myxococcaceae bacterium]